MTSLPDHPTVKRAFKRWAGPALAAIREAPTWIDHATARSGAPKVAFLPAKGTDDGAARLRHIELSKALKRLGWDTTVLSWRLSLSQRRRLLATLSPDIVVMQGVRHHLNRPSLYSGHRIVFDMDDADFHLPHLAEPVAKAVTQANAVIAGSTYIANWCSRAGAGQVHVIWTGTPTSVRPYRAHRNRLPVVAWAQTRPHSYTREAAFVRYVMNGIARQVPEVVFRLYDRRADDPAWFGDEYKVEWLAPLPYKAYVQSFNDVAVGLAPLSAQSPFSRGKSFGKLLAYMDRGVPSFVSDLGEPACFFTDQSGVVGNDPDHWIAKAVELLRMPEQREEMAGHAYKEFERRLSIDAAARHTDRVLRQVLAERRS